MPAVLPAQLPSASGSVTRPCILYPARLAVTALHCLHMELLCAGLCPCSTTGQGSHYDSDGRCQKNNLCTFVCGTACRAQWRFCCDSRAGARLQMICNQLWAQSAG